MAENKTLVEEEKRDGEGEEEEAEETLSLCDLPLYSDRSSEWEEDCSSSSFSSQENEYFEFSSRELISSAKSASLPENIIFCGKLIPYKQPDNKIVESKEPVAESKKTLKSLFSWNFITSKRSSKVHVSNSTNGTKSNRDERKMSVLMPTLSGKAGRYLCMFGISSFNQEAVLRDWKSRQKSRKQPLSPMFGFPSTAENNGGCKSGDKGMWGLVRALSCGANHPTATLVAASMQEF